MSIKEEYSELKFNSKPGTTKQK